MSGDLTGFPERPLEFEIRCPVDTQVLPVLRCIVTSLSTQMGFTQEECERIEMAVDEACANVVRHAYKHLGLSPDVPADKRRPQEEMNECSLWLRFHISQEQLRICVIDRGIGIKDQPGGYSSVQEYQARGGDGGLGVYIIRNFMDEVEYDCPPDSGTVLTMVKYLRAAT
jgi:serine/threonine-protein kinase RsbW